ncbi:phosphatase PAP2 family protein [Brucella pseudogrignonensis]|uniref:Membrane-associated phospholipid phosphatase n=1 Tax=Brucella pseudogrignonensis TaxID=419475 RepID=A0ABU1MF87_9HYPH|nr:phosphatase PAP2 family protein [Brucella pseudogrignonensis]MDR6434707.1 membrane-associated phospholipid phosphatase [Brucella pseudogrignonensis]
MQISTSSRVEQPNLNKNKDAPLALQINLAITALLASSFLFIIFPNLDLAIIRIFANGHNFPLSENWILLAIRDANRRSMIYLLTVMIIFIALYSIKPHKFNFFRPHKAFFVILSFLIGPFLTVQLLKGFIGRARPRGLLEFGGTADFTPVWQYAAQCGRNCSFPSGEAATAAATLSLIILLPIKWRWIGFSVLTPTLIFASFNRVMFGAHFPSDVIVAWAIMCCLMTWLWQRITNNSEQIDSLIESLGSSTHRLS